VSLRSKRLAKRLDPAASAFLDSTLEDAGLLLDDIIGSLAHVSVLEDAKVLDATEAGRLRSALRHLFKDASEGEVPLFTEHEDVHMNVEVALTKVLGDLGKKLHTARSRNDQVATDLRLFAQRWTLETAARIRDLVESLLWLSKKHPKAVLPGYTHLQVAQPILLSFHLQAHAERFLRDLARLRDAYERLLVSPLGAGALAGTTHPIDPSISANALGFDRSFRNAADAVSDRDYLAELLFAASLALTHASGLAEEFILFTNQSFGFATIGDDYATGSSIMPQKKNPDVFEVTRARSGTLLGALVASLSGLKALPLAYNRDLQEQKRLFVQTFPLVAPNFGLLARMLRSVTFHPERMEAAANEGYGDATELADYLVRQGTPFRDAHHQSATLVRMAGQKKVPLAALTAKEFAKVNPKIGADVVKHLGPHNAVKGRKSPGSTGPAHVEAGRKQLLAELATIENFFVAAGQAREAAWMTLLGKTSKVKK
jgi:argininosuccinate lyase